jgi:hypothetical protein
MGIEKIGRVFISDRKIRFHGFQTYSKIGIQNTSVFPISTACFEKLAKMET